MMKAVVHFKKLTGIFLNLRLWQCGSRYLQHNPVQCAGYQVSEGGRVGTSWHCKRIELAAQAGDGTNNVAGPRWALAPRHINSCCGAILDGDFTWWGSGCCGRQIAYLLKCLYTIGIPPKKINDHIWYI